MKAKTPASMNALASKPWPMVYLCKFATINNTVPQTTKTLVGQFFLDRERTQQQIILKDYFLCYYKITITFMLCHQA